MTDVTPRGAARFSIVDRESELALVRRVREGDRARSTKPDGGDGIGLWPSCTRESPFEQTAGSELERRLEVALASLPVAFREVLLLVGVEGMRPSEAAVVCGVSPETLRQRLKRARDLLAVRLESTPASTVARIATFKVRA